MLLSLLPGCIGSPANPAATQPATALDPKSAEPAYWYDQPAAFSVESPDYDALWGACRLAARDLGFTVDLLDYRQGLMTSQPLVSKQIFEPWKHDVLSGHALVESSLSTMRRTIRFEIHRLGDGVGDGGGDASPELPGLGFRCVPKVLVEHYAVTEHRITDETEYRDIFSLTRRELNMLRDKERDPTSTVPPVYWYAVGRDRDVERRLAELIREHAGRRALTPAVAARAAQ